MENYLVKNGGIIMEELQEAIQSAIQNVLDGDNDELKGIIIPPFFTK